MKIQVLCGGQTLALDVARVVNAGYAGCDQAAVKAHIDELAVIGIPAPRRVPTFYPVPTLQLIQGGAAIQVCHGQTSAEVEYVYIVSGGKAYITVGSDHSDRALEAYGVPPAKQICPNLIAGEVWEYAAVRDHLDKLALLCEIYDGGGWRVYQQGTAADLLPPERLLELGAAAMPENRDGLVLFSGTIATLGEITYGDRWRVSMTDTVTGKRLGFEYTVERLPDSIE